MKKPVHPVIQNARDLINRLSLIRKEGESWKRESARHSAINSSAWSPAEKAKRYPNLKPLPPAPPDLGALEFGAADAFAVTLLCMALANLRGKLHMKEYGRYGRNGWCYPMVEFNSLADQRAFLVKQVKDSYRMRYAPEAQAAIVALLALGDERAQRRQAHADDRATG